MCDMNENWYYSYLNSLSLYNGTNSPLGRGITCMNVVHAVIWFFQVTYHTYILNLFQQPWKCSSSNHVALHSLRHNIQTFLLYLNMYVNLQCISCILAWWTLCELPSFASMESRTILWLDRWYIFVHIQSINTGYIHVYTWIYKLQYQA